MTRARVLLPTLALLAGLAGPAAAQSVVFGVARDGSGLPGQPVSIPVWADMSASGGARLGSYTMRVAFDPTVLSFAYYATIRPGTFATPVVNADSASQGVLRLAAVSAAGGEGYVDLGSLVFDPYLTGTTSIAVAVQEASAAGTFADLLPLVTTSDGMYCAARGRWGDTDDDGDANSRDALAVLSGVVGLDPGLAFDLTLGDVDGDGRTDTRDALILLSYAVGLDITGQRVMTVAPGACALPGAADLSVAPDTVDVVVGQQTTLRVTSRSGGVPVVLNGLNWVVDDPRVGSVDPVSFAFIARDTGTTTLRAALGPGIEATVPVIVRAGRPVWHVDGNVARGAIALGTARFPFWTPQQAFRLLREGDTIRVAPGIVDYDDQLGDEVAVGFVLQGDTLADGTRPVLRAPSACCYAAYLYDAYYSPPAGAAPAGGSSAGAAADGRRRIEFHNLTLQNFAAALYARGLSDLIARNVQVEAGPFSWLYAFEIDNPADTVDLERVDIVADSATGGGYALYVEGGSFLRAVDLTVRHLNTAIYLGESVDSVHIANSTFANLKSDALSFYGFDRAIHGLYIGNSRFVDNFRGLAGFEIQRATLVNNVWQNNQRESIQLYAPYYATRPPGPVRYTITGDSIRSPGYSQDWLEADQFDTLRVTDVHVAIDTSFVSMYVWGTHAEFRRTVLDGATYEGFDVDVSSAVFDTVSVLGCASCAYTTIGGIRVDAPTGRAGPTVTVRGGTFRRLFDGIFSANANVPGPLTVIGAAIDSVRYGIRGFVDSAVIAENTLGHIHDFGIDIRPSGDRPASQFYTFERNTVSCRDTTGTQYGIYAERTSTSFAGNFVQDCDYGLYVYNSLATLLDVAFSGDSVFAAGVASAQRGIYVQNRWRPTLYGVRTRGAVYGIEIATNDTGTVRIDSSAVSQATSAGMRLAPGTGTVVVGVRNNVTNNLLDGVLNAGSGTRTLTQGRFVGNGRWAVNSSASFDASGNWWGSASGPGGGTGDSVTTQTSVITTSFLTVDPTDVPAPAPPVFAALLPVTLPLAATTPPAAPSALVSGERPASETGVAAREAARLRKQQLEDQRRRRHRP